MNALAVLLLLLQGPPPAAGERLYLANCALCHGPRGEGATGPALAGPVLAEDERLFGIIRSGIAGTGMPGTRHFTDDDIRLVMAHIRSFRPANVARATGDAARGQNLFRGKGGCLRCHAVGGSGGILGPDLTDVGARRGPDYLRTSILDPEAWVPENFLVYRWFTVIPDSFLQVSLETRDGKRITGVRINEDSFSIQIRDLSGRFHSFWKRELAALDRQWGKSPMPSFRGALTESEVEDLVAYLSALRGHP